MYFDLDGVLVDSRPGIVRCINETLIEFGYGSVAPQRIERIIGPPLREGFADLIAACGGDGRDVAACVSRYRELYQDIAASGGTLLQPGIADMLDKITPDALLAIATSKPLRFAEPILCALGIRDLFTVVAGPTPEFEHETKTGTLARAMKAIEQSHGAILRNNDTFMVGDRHHDMTAALGCGIVPIGAAWGFGSESELSGAGAQHIVRTPAELPPLLRNVVGAS